MNSNGQKKHVVEVALPLGRSRSTLTYLRPSTSDLQESWLGRRVQVQIGKRKALGIITCENDVAIPQGVTLKEIQFTTDRAPVLTKNQLALSRFVSDYYHASFYDCLKLGLPKHNRSVEAKVFEANSGFLEDLKQIGHSSKSSRIRRAQLNNLGFTNADINQLLSQNKLRVPSRTRVDESVYLDHNKYPNHALNNEQNEAVKIILESEENSFLLEGITGSGKTEVYLAVAKKVLAANQSVLFIVPEIALTPQLFNRVSSSLGVKPALIHSNVPSSERDIIFENIRSGQSRVIIGARSALFCPAKDLGFIVIDEEHDTGYKQDESPRYHARDVALWRAKNENAKIVLGSATPSLESLYNAKNNRLMHLRLTKRAGGQGLLPKVEIIDLKERRLHEIHRLRDRPASHGQGLCILSSPLHSAIEETLKLNQQVILFLNRRGWASHLICESCGDIARCPDCSISLTYHKKAHLLRCHQCMYTQAFTLKCPNCPKGELTPLGLGTERVEKELKLSFPSAQVARFDRESIKHPRQLENVLDDLHEGRIDILVGTQMLAKGHDFPNVTLVGVILADSGLGIPDFRASERSFQLLTQVAGRSGRRDKQGRVLIQTFNPEHRAIQFAKEHDPKGFSKLELAERKSFIYPPFCRAALVRIECPSEDMTKDLSIKIREEMDRILHDSKLEDRITVLGPAPCANVKLRKHFRWQLFIKAETVSERQYLLRSISEIPHLEKTIKKAKGRLIIDIDPVQML